MIVQLDGGPAFSHERSQLSVPILPSLSLLTSCLNRAMADVPKQPAEATARAEGLEGQAPANLSAAVQGLEAPAEPAKIKTQSAVAKERADTVSLAPIAPQSDSDATVSGLRRLCY